MIYSGLRVAPGNHRSSHEFKSQTNPQPNDYLLIAAGLAAYFAFQRRSAEILEDIQELVRRTAGMVALNINGNDLAAIQTNEDGTTPEFQRIESILNRARKVIGISEKEIYIMRPVEGLFDVEFVVMTERPRYIGNRYPIRPENEKPFKAAFTTAVPQFTDLYEDEHGTWISGHGPIQDSTGEVVAVLEVDFEVGRFLKRKNEELWTLAGLAGAMTLLGGFLAAAFTSPLVSVVRKLTDAFREFGQGNFPKIEDVKRKDEMGRLVEGFNAMSYNLHLSQYQLQEAVKSLNSVAEKAPSMFLGKDKRLVTLLVLENIAARDTLADAEVSCSYRLNPGDEMEKHVVVNAWPPDRQATHVETLPLTLDSKDYGQVTLKCAGDYFPVDLQIARIWANFLAAIFATRDMAEEAGREAKSEAVEAATERFLNQIREIEKNLKIDSGQGSGINSEAPVGFRRAAKRIELVKRDLSLLSRDQEKVGTPAAHHPIGLLLNETIREFRAGHPSGMPVSVHDLTTAADAAADSKKLQALLLTLLSFCERSQKHNPPEFSAAAELTAKATDAGLRISIQSNMPALSVEEMERILKTGQGEEVFDENLLPLPMARLVIESVGGTIDYQAGVGHGGLFLIRIPLLRATATVA